MGLGGELHSGLADLAHGVLNVFWQTVNRKVHQGLNCGLDAQASSLKGLDDLQRTLAGFDHLWLESHVGVQSGVIGPLGGQRGEADSRMADVGEGLVEVGGQFKAHTCTVLSNC